MYMDRFCAGIYLPRRNIRADEQFSRGSESWVFKPFVLLETQGVVHSHTLVGKKPAEVWERLRRCLETPRDVSLRTCHQSCQRTGPACPPCLKQWLSPQCTVPAWSSLTRECWMLTATSTLSRWVQPIPSPQEKAHSVQRYYTYAGWCDIEALALGHVKSRVVCRVPSEVLHRLFENAAGLSDLVYWQAFSRGGCEEKSLMILLTATSRQ